MSNHVQSHSFVETAINNGSIVVSKESLRNTIENNLVVSTSLLLKTFYPGLPSAWVCSLKPHVARLVETLALATEEPAQRMMEVIITKENRQEKGWLSHAQIGFPIAMLLFKGTELITISFTLTGVGDTYPFFAGNSPVFFMELRIKMEYRTPYVPWNCNKSCINVHPEMFYNIIICVYIYI